jgi:hypothetical protein
MVNNMKSRYRLFQRNTGIYFCEDRQTGAQASLRTTDAAEAERLLNAKNEAEAQPGFALHIGKAYLAVADPAIARRLWSFAVEELIKTKRGENARRWRTATKDKALAPLWKLPLIETRPEHFLVALNKGTVSTNVYLRRLHNFALGIGWLPTPVLPPMQWPRVHHKVKRAITLDEHTRIVERERNAERRAFYQMLWELGGAQGDVAKLTAEDLIGRLKPSAILGLRLDRRPAFVSMEKSKQSCKSSPRRVLYFHICAVCGLLTVQRNLSSVAVDWVLKE